MVRPSKFLFRERLFNSIHFSSTEKDVTWTDVTVLQEQRAASSPWEGIRIGATGMLGLAIAMGVGRFAFTPMLPLMLEHGQVSIRSGALMASINLAAYLVGALTGATVRTRHWVLLVAGLGLCSMSVMAMGLTRNLMLWVALRAIAGVASAWSLIGLTHWSLARLTAIHANAWRGFVFAGPGVGIAASGLLVSGLDAIHWHPDTIWVALGLLSCGGGVFVASRTRDGLPRSSAEGRTTERDGVQLRLPKALLIVAYGLAGYGYITIATFLPLVVRERLGIGSVGAALWPLLGLAAALGAIGLGLLPGHHNTRLLAGSYLLQAIGVIAPELRAGVHSLMVSAILVGGTFMVIVMVTMHEAKSRYRETSLIAWLTASYALGQMVGPYAAALILQGTHSFALALEFSSVALFLAAILTLVEHALWRKHDSLRRIQA
ncbi:MAG: YbfB/YjiJ family MFS transporter [Polyangiaceae bacterium]|nr:YbfB/YjiJ family MFS transporter [Polyangiaceae bacterium]